MDRRPRVAFLVAVGCLLLLVGAAGAESFFEGGRSGFFEPGAGAGITGAPTRGQPGSVESVGPSAETQSGAPTTALKSYRWSFAVSETASFMTGINAIPSHMGLSAEWSPVSHLGIGLRGGALLPWALGLAVQESSFAGVVTVADDSSGSGREFYHIWYGDAPSTLDLELNASFYLGSRGLSGLYIRLAGGALVNVVAPEFYLSGRDGNDSQIVLLNGSAGDTSSSNTFLPALGPVTLRIMPSVGLRLVLSGFTLDVNGGYALYYWGRLSGFTIAASLGWSL
jgi:hypothetical protein